MAFIPGSRMKQKIASAPKAVGGFNKPVNDTPAAAGSTAFGGGAEPVEVAAAPKTARPPKALGGLGLRSGIAAQAARRRRK